MNTKSKWIAVSAWARRRSERGGGGGGSSGDYRRTGTGMHERYYSIPDQMYNLITSNAASATTDPSLATKQTTLFGNLMDGAMSASSQPGYSQVAGFAGLSPTEYGGREALMAASQRDPYSGAYAQQTLDSYRQNAADAMSTVASGPAAVRGGDARTGVMQGVLAERLAAGRGQELRNAQLQDLGGVITAARSMGDIENTRLTAALRAALGLSDIANATAQRGLQAGQQVDVNKAQNLALLQLASQLQGKTIDRQTDDFEGEGDQSGWQAGLSCCFIFLEALNGELPWYIELARFEHLTPTRHAGYKWMGTWLVPMMRRNRVARWWVNVAMVKPFLQYGAWLYGESNSVSWANALTCEAWLRLWSTLGSVVMYARRLHRTA